MNEQEVKEFEELSTIVKAHGYMRLDTHEKRKRYSELKAMAEGTPEETVTIRKTELQAMIDKSINDYKKEAVKSFQDDDEGLDEAKKIGKWIKSKQLKKPNPTASMRVYRADGDSEAGLIIDWKYLKKAFNEETRAFDIDIYRVKVLFDRGEEFVDMPLSQMVQINEFEKVEIIKQETEEKEMITGVGQKAMTQSGYAFSSPGFFGTKGQMTGEDFNYVVKKKDTICTIKRPEGKGTLVLNADRLNQ